MISIKTLKISDDRKSISVDVSTSVGNVFTNIYIRPSGSNVKTSLSSNFVGTGNREVFFITNVDAGVLEEFNGIYFMEFETDDTVADSGCTDCPGATLEQAVWNFALYETCLFNETLKLDLSSKKAISLNADAIKIGLLLDTMERALNNGWYDNAVKMEDIFKEYCGIDCTSCEKLVTYQKGTGLDKGRLNDTLILK